jgi:hypothetical protein
MKARHARDTNSMSEQIVNTLLEVAMVIDTAQHADAATVTDPSFLAASKVVRFWRRDRIEKTDDPVMTIRYLKELDTDLASINGAAEGAVSEARRLIKDLLQSCTEAKASISAKTVLYSALFAGAALGPAALLNGSILDNQCEGQLRAGCQGLPPAQQHVDQREPAQPLLGAHQFMAITTSTTPVNFGSYVSGRDGSVSFGTLTGGPFKLT